MANVANADGFFEGEREREMAVFKRDSKYPSIQRSLGYDDADSPWDFIAEEVDSEASSPISLPALPPPQLSLPPSEQRKVRIDSTPQLIGGSYRTVAPAPVINKVTNGTRHRRQDTPIPEMYLKGLADLDRLVILEPHQYTQCSESDSADGDSAVKKLGDNRCNITCGGLRGCSSNSDSDGDRDRRPSWWLSCSGMGCGGGHTHLSRGPSRGGSCGSPTYDTLVVFDQRSP
jgi:hypothetical protein